MNATIRRIESNDRFSQAVIHRNTIYLTGQVALDNPHASTDVQMGEILHRIDTLLTAGSTSKSNILMANIWLRNLNDYDTMNAIWDKWIDSSCTPARACVQAELVATFKVEISIVAAVPHSVDIQGSTN
jgi:enamine deaminase RidA (YjgF/YER057c/UK114 family)